MQTNNNSISKIILIFTLIAIHYNVSSANNSINLVSVGRGILSLVGMSCNHPAETGNSIFVIMEKITDHPQYHNPYFLFEGEIFKDIDGWRDFYQISNLGRVKSLERTSASKKGNNNYHRHLSMCILRHAFDGNYYFVRLCLMKRKENKTIHRLLATAFIPNPLCKPEVNHKNGIKKDFSLNNLEWMTRKENAEHAWANGLMHPNGAKGLSRNKGCRNPQAKLKESDIVSINKLYRTKSITQKELGIMFNVTQSNISNIINHRNGHR